MKHKIAKSQEHKYDCTCFVTEDGCECGGCGGDFTCSSECLQCIPKSREDWEKEFEKEFTYRKQGQWFKNLDGYVDENDKFVKKPHQAYMVPDFIKQFIHQTIHGLEIELDLSQRVNRILTDQLFKSYCEHGKKHSKTCDQCGRSHLEEENEKEN